MTKTNHRPKGVTYLLVFVLIFTGWYLLRLISTVADWRTLKDLPLEVSPLYLALSGFAWTVLGMAVLWGILFAKSYLPPLLRMLGIIFPLFFIADKAFIQAGGFQQSDWGFDLLSSAFGFLALFWILSLKKTQNYFGVHDERKQEN